jgi:UDP-N-acetyl-D-mannosaminuronate dehydrogenase
LRRPNVLVIGLGEVGLPLFELLRQSGKFNIHGYDIDKKKMKKIGQDTLPSAVDIMHICYPCYNQEKFVKTTTEYINKFNPKLTIIHSTVTPGTTEKVFRLSNRHVAHSPIRGVHKSVESMKKDLQFWTKYIGGASKESTELASKHLKSAGFKTKVLRSCLETELAKLFETTSRAMLIAWYQEMHRISKALGADFDEVVDFLEDTHRVRLDRPVLFPGVIGGHCVIPNAKLLLKAYNSQFVKLILKSNEKRKKEIEDKRVLEEIRKIRERYENLEKWAIKLSGKDEN